MRIRKMREFLFRIIHSKLETFPTPLKFLYLLRGTKAEILLLHPKAITQKNRLHRRGQFLYFRTEIRKSSIL